ncbi:MULTISPECIES: DHH family phosphoesterase [unclassified Leptolyngbya]|uniref:DHH family phosphoesterase n=1 Tax=unclassified Leptolyngbya TaxID=2650499 RepID=UPI0016826EFF|nr:MULTISPECIES: DHH family phosphoesterase [unclassified Leptolyngbya]MBD1909440.1 DHH family phosphoesterase [Leptolyngbya sp. FACHB-8]MBD2155663.1 DHH family phosphoesterase [Leptolyngbya sp. FACHB-16]
MNIPDLNSACQAFKTFVDRISTNAPVTGAYDSDADGVTAGVVWQRAFERAGFARIHPVIPDRERNVWTEANRDRIASTQPEFLFVMDLGSGSEAVLDGVPTCFIDHHHPEGVPDGDTLISAYTWDPIPNTSWLVWQLCQSIADVSDLDWIAAIGTLSDLGDRAPFDLLTQAKRKYTAKYLKEATALINASRRASHYQPEAAVAALLNHSDPKSLVNSNSSEVVQLRQAREEVKHALEEARKVAPIFAGKVALLQLNSPCQIHPLIAQSWRSRLPGYVVIAANEGYIPNRINFSARSNSINVLEFLRSHPLSGGEGNYANGHDQASGGSLPRDRWQQLLTQLGFSKA